MQSGKKITYCPLAIATALFLMLLSSCNIYRYVPPGEYLFIGSKISFVTKNKENGEIKSALLSKNWPVPNKKTFFTPFSLISYSISKPPTGKGVNYWLHDKLGEPPVLLSQANPFDMRRRMTAQMHDMGYLNATVKDSVILDGRNGYISFSVSTGERYLIDTLIFPADSSKLSKAIAAASAQTFLKKGEPFTLELVKAERERIDLDLRNKGYFYFNPDFLVLAADTNHNKRVYSSILIKPGIPHEAGYIYTIKNFTIYSNYSSDRDSILHTLPARQEKGFKQVDILPRFKPELFSENILIKEGDIYSYKKQKTTVQRMVNLNNFKFINTTFTPADTNENPSLDVSLYLTPYTKRSLQAEFGAYTKTTNYTGSEVKLKLTNRNLFHTGDHVDLNLSVGFEAQFNRNGADNYTNQYFSGSVNFYTPHFFMPFNIIRSESDYIPKNKISAGVEYLRKSQLYTMRSVILSFGYIWKSGKNWEHSLDPLVVNLVNPTNITPKYDSTLAEDPNLAKSFEKQFIVGGEYTLTYNSQNSQSSSFSFYNITAIGLSGNVLSLIVPPASTSGDQEDFLGIPYAQYLLASNDFRVYTKLGQKTTWVNRWFLGYGFSYANSQIMPYVKQFFIGGSTSMRAFRAGTLGPGSYTDSIIQSQQTQAGEVKIEYNSEFRIKLIKKLYSALFTDIGNIWYRTEQPGQPGSGFTKNWVKELAVDAGVGLRFDASIMLIRFDVAIPLRIPSNPADQRWVVDEIDIGSKQWRKENVMLNIAFGYPF